MVSARVEQTLERFQEDERLTSDLTDSAATALLAWIEQQVMAADAIADEHLFEQQVATIRASARAAASDGDDPSTTAVVERAQAALEAAAAQPSAPPAAPTSQISAPAPAAGVVEPITSQPSQTGLADATGAVATAPAESGESLLPAGTSFLRTLRRRFRRWTHRKAS